MSPVVTVGTLAEVALLSRPRSIDPKTVYCSQCWEAIAHDGDEWRHVRTGTSAHWKHHDCRPLCDWPGCTHDADPSRSICKREFTGASMRFRAEHFLCTEHCGAYRKTHAVIEQV